MVECERVIVVAVLYCLVFEQTARSPPFGCAETRIHLEDNGRIRYLERLRLPTQVNPTAQGSKPITSAAGI
jgi:hypothetical protein